MAAKINAKIKDHEHDWRLDGDEAYCADSSCDAREDRDTLVLTGWKLPEQASEKPVTQMRREQGT